MFLWKTFLGYQNGGGGSSVFWIDKCTSCYFDSGFIWALYKGLLHLQPI